MFSEITWLEEEEIHQGVREEISEVVREDKFVGLRGEIFEFGLKDISEEVENENPWWTCQEDNPPTSNLLER